MKKIIIVLMLFAAGNARCQGIGSELYQYKYSFIHPAFAGSQGQGISMLGQTTAYDRSFGNTMQSMVLVGYENYFEKINSGIAVTGYSQRLGYTSLSSVGLSYNYRITLGESSALITGVRAGTHYHSFSASYIPVEPSDPIIDANFSASNWTADLGVLFKMKAFYFGGLANNLAHSNATLDLIGSPDPLDNNYAAIIGTSLTLGEHLKSEHSLYIPFSGDDVRMDLNNTLTINDRFLAGLSVERSNEKFYPRANAGIKFKDYFQVVFLLYSKKRDDFMTPRFRGEVFMSFAF